MRVLRLQTRQLKLSHIADVESLVFGTLYYLFCLISIPKTFFDMNSTIVTWLSMLILTFSSLAMIVEIRKRRFSLATVHWVFVTQFFVVAPAIQQVYNDDRWGYYITPQIREKTLWLILVWCVTYNASRYFSTKVVQMRQRRVMNYGDKDIFILLCISLICLAVLALVFGGQLFNRSHPMRVEVSSTAMQIIDKTGRGIVISLVPIVLGRSAARRLTPWISASFIILLITCFPAGMARYKTASIYLAVAFVLVHHCAQGRIRRSAIMAYCLVVAVTVAFPIMRDLRNIPLLSEGILGSARSVLSSQRHTYLSGDFDAFSRVSATYDYTLQQGFSNGWQLIGVILFWVPRRFWPGKPVGSGFLVETARGREFTNVSSPLPAEGYINYGITGLILFAVVIGLLTGALDNYCWNKRNEYMMNSPIRIVYPFFLGLFFFMMRGDLLSSFAYTVGLCAPVVAVGRLYSTRLNSNH